MPPVNRSLQSRDWKPSPDFASPPSPGEGLEAIVGINNLVSIAWLDRALTIAASVARVVVGGRIDSFGTGFLVGKDLLLTNNHVLPDEMTALASSVQFNYQLAWTGELAPSRTYAVAKFERTNKELDYTLVRLAGDPGSIFGGLTPSDHSEVVVNDFLVIVQHPSGGPKQIALMDNKVSAVFGNLLQYTTDTKPGASGAPCFNTRWQLVGLHHAGGELVGPDGKSHFVNEGIRFSALVADASGLLGEADMLYSLGLGELRPQLLQMLELGVPGGNMVALAGRLLATNPTLADVVVARLAVPSVGTPPAVAMVAAGAALGGALIRWRESGSSSGAVEVVGISPGPREELVKLFGTVLQQDAAPAAVYRNALASIVEHPDAVSALTDGVSEPLELALAAVLFLKGVITGASAVIAARA